jgi:glycosyltransferase involved in cell wall biosynthesis
MVRLLLVAPTCDADDVGEAWVAYQWASRLAEEHEVTLLTYFKRGRQPAGEQLRGLRVIEWQEPPLIGRAERLNSMLKPAYIPFYLRARRWIRRAQANGETFDIAHQVTPVATRYPSPAAGFSFPLVVGPVGGGLQDPPGFKGEDTSPWFVGLRSLDGFRLRHDPILRRTYSTASCVLGIAPYVADNLRAVPLRRFQVMGDVGLAEMPPKVESRPTGLPLRLLFVGRLIRTKGARDAIAALQHLQDLNLTLDIVGDGFDRGACEDLVARLGLGDRVRFHGRLPHGEVMTRFQHADVFVFPSYREPGGTVVFEAMGASIPLIVCTGGGPGSVVDDTCGIRLDAITPRQLSEDIAEAIRTLAGDPVRRHAMGLAARERLATVGLWDSKIRAANALYEELISLDQG